MKYHIQGVLLIVTPTSWTQSDDDKLVGCALFIHPQHGSRTGVGSLLEEGTRGRRIHSGLSRSGEIQSGRPVAPGGHREENNNYKLQC